MIKKWTDGFRLGDHIIHPYTSDLDKDRAVRDLFSWAPHSSKFYYFADGKSYERLFDRANGASDSITEALRDERFSMLSAKKSYCPDGTFDGPRMVRLLSGICQEAQDNGFHSTIAVGDVTLVSKIREHFPAFIRYETSVDFVDFPTKVAFLCQYDRRYFSPAEINKAISVHQQSLVDRTLARNYWIISRKGTGGNLLQEKRSS